jgi:hypothetical protein
MDVFERIGLALMIFLGALSASIILLGIVHFVVKPVIIWGAGG